jgi:hypothetical protein
VSFELGANVNVDKARQPQKHLTQRISTLDGMQTDRNAEFSMNMSPSRVSREPGSNVTEDK